MLSWGFYPDLNCRGDEVPFPGFEPGDAHGKDVVITARPRTATCVVGLPFVGRISGIKLIVLGVLLVGRLTLVRVFAVGLLVVGLLSRVHYLLWVCCVLTGHPGLER